jgi:ABC-2 type transport system permease protein
LEVDSEMIRKQAELLRLFGLNCKLTLESGMAYRADFMLGLLTSLAFTSMGPIVQYLIFTQTKGYPGWNTDQILLFQGIFLFSMGLNNTIFGAVREKALSILRNGDFDRYLLKPYSAIGILLAGGFSLKDMGSLLAGTGITVSMMIRMRLAPGPLDILLFVWFIAVGALVFMGITILLCGLVIVLVQMGRIPNFFDNVLRFAGYPLNIYSGLFKAVFLTVFPLAVLAYLPSQALLHRLDWSMVWGSLGGLLIVWLSLKFWGYCLSKYTSAGG